MPRSAPPRLGATLLAAALVAGCAVGPDYAPEPPTEAGEAWRAELGAELGLAREDIGRWWEGFEDDELSQLVARALEANVGLAEAAARLREARAGIRLQNAGRLPVVQGQAEYRREELGEEAIESRTQSFSGGGGFPIKDAQFDTWSGGLQASWELDLFGRIGRLVESAEADAQAVVEAYRGLVVALCADVAEAVIELRALSARRGLLERNIALQEESLEIAEARLVGGLGTELEASQARTLLASTRAQRPQLRKLQALARNRLALLLGERADPRRALEPAPLPELPNRLRAGLPAELLTRRPDLREAERRYHAAVARVGAAQAERYPRLILNGSFSLQARDFDRMGSADARAWSFGPQVILPIFEGGRIAANVSAREAAAEAARLRLKQAALGAIAEVEGALASAARDREVLSETAAAVSAARRSAELAQDLYQAGGTSFLDVIDAQRNLARLEDDEVLARQAALRSIISLYRALGGGWEALEAAPEES